jgi:hypothetical protein
MKRSILLAAVAGLSLSMPADDLSRTPESLGPRLIDSRDGARTSSSVDSCSEPSEADLPQLVRATVQQQAAGRSVADIDREIWNGQTVYEIEFAQTEERPDLRG